MDRNFDLTNNGYIMPLNKKLWEKKRIVVWKIIVWFEDILFFRIDFGFNFFRNNKNAEDWYDGFNNGLSGVCALNNFTGDDAIYTQHSRQQGCAGWYGGK